MLYSIGDSHADFSFRNIDIVSRHHVGPVTLKRVGVDTTVLAPVLAQLPIGVTDTAIFVFGEIDIRCYVKPNLLHRPITLEQLVGAWADKYVQQVARTSPRNIHKAIMSVVPPSPAHIATTATFPVAGTDEERVQYTRVINGMLKTCCQKYGCLFLDVSTPYEDSMGMLRRELSDGSLHIGDTQFVRNVLNDNHLS